MSERAVPFHCPYCGEEDLRPFGDLDDPHGQWRCGSCRRAFRLRMIGLTREGNDDPTHADRAGGAVQDAEAAPRTAVAPARDGR